MPTAPHLPDPHQRLLLRAALSAAEASRAAWDEWRSRSRWETEPIDEASTRLLPLVYQALARLDPAPIDLPRLQGLYRRTWYENNRLLQLAKPAIRALVADGHEVMILKGASLTLRHYNDRGVRPMRDIDVLVADGHAEDALATLERLGWTGNEPGQTARDVLARHHGVGLIHESGGRIDLHRRLLADSPQDADGPLWERAETAAIDDVRVLAPCAADELLLACVHGWSWAPKPSIRWIPDAIVVMRQMAHDDWQRCVQEGRRRRVSLRLARALRVLHDELDASAPAGMLADLEAGPFASFEAAEERNHTRQPGLLPPGLARAYFAHVRNEGPPGGPSWWIGCARRFWFVRNPPSGLHFVPWLAQWARRRVRSGIDVRRAAGDPRS